MDTETSAHPPAPGRGRLLLIAAAWTLGIAWGNVAPHHARSAASLAALLATGAGMAHLTRQPRAALGAAALVTTFAGVAWAGGRAAYRPAHHMAHLALDDPQPVHVLGHVTSDPVRWPAPTTPLARFTHHAASSTFTVEAVRLLGTTGTAATCGELLVRVDDEVPHVQAGMVVAVRGVLVAPSPSMNPGGFDARRHARARGRAGTINVPQASLIRAIDDSNVRPARWSSWRHAVQRRAGAALNDALARADMESGPRRALLEALLLGRRSPEFHDLHGAFQRVGVAHVLAISGLHLGLVAGLTLLVLRMLRLHRRIQGLAIIGLVLAYLLLVETRMPVLRAGVMTVIASLGLVLGRRLAADGLLALCAILLLAWRPDQVSGAGFQLSFGVVLGLIHGAPVLRRAWFGPPDPLAPSALAMLDQTARTVIAAACCAWIVATPIIMHHFGLVSPLAAPLSVIVMPLVGMLLVLGFLTMLIGLVIAPLAVVPGWLLGCIAQPLLDLITVMDAVPGSSLRVPFVPMWWTMGALGCFAMALRSRSRRRRRLTVGTAVGLAIWLLWPAPGPALRLDMIAVGNGTCIVVRSGGQTLVYDAGSSTVVDVGSRVLVPTLHRLGVRCIDVLVISHANLDHYSGVPALLDAFDVATVRAPAPLIRAASTDGEGPVATLLASCADAGVAIRPLGAEDVLQIGPCVLTCVHPEAGVSYRRVNDSSIALLGVCAGVRILLCGDAEREALARLDEHLGSLRVDVLELPHHGSHSAQAEAFVRARRPRVVLQSTGTARLRDDRWATALGQVDRLITARDGACTVEIRDDGTIRTRRHRPGPRLR